MKARLPLIGLLIALAGPAHAEDRPVDYQKLDFSLQLSTFRAGNHDESGINDYFFELQFYGLPLIKEELRKPLAERKKSDASGGRFAQLKIPNLSYWIPDKKAVGTRLDIKGDVIRALVSDTMRTFSVGEDQTAVQAVLKLYEDNKKFKYLGEDTLVGEVTFDIIPDSLPHGPKLVNQTLTIRDKTGAFAEMQLEYESAAVQAAATPSTSPGSAPSR